MATRRAVPAFAEIQASLASLDGTTASAVSLLTGMTVQELDELGGFTRAEDATQTAA